MRSKFRAFNASVTMRIGGEVVNKINARYDYRCAECLGELDYWNNGLACKADKGHRHFVYKLDVPAIQALRDAEVAEMSESYEIIDGLLKPKGELSCL